MPVGLVVVSHSRALADAAVELARGMLPGRELAVGVAAGGSLDDALRAAAEAAAAGRDATEPLVARKGRASYLGERSAGHVDPGAASATLLVEAAATALAGRG